MLLVFIVDLAHIQQLASPAYCEDLDLLLDAVDHAVGAKDHLSDPPDTDLRNNTTALRKIHQALDRMTEKKPDVISLDLVMPKMSGLNFFKYIQKNKDRAGIPVVVVTAHARDEMGSDDLKKIEKHKSEECRIFLLEKPVDAPTYVNTIRQALDLEPLGPESEEGEALRMQVKDAVQAADKEALKNALKILKGD